MLATRMIGLELFRPTVVRVHEPPVSLTKHHPRYAPALSFPQYITAQQAIEALRQIQAENDSIYYLFVTDHEEHLVGVISLRSLLIAAPGSQLFEFMDRRIITLPYDASLEEQASLMSETGLLALPVVDEEGRLVGAMDINDILAAVKDETTEAMYGMVGIHKQEDMADPIMHVARDRLLWLLLNMGGLVLVVWMIAAFLPTIGNLVLLATLLPLVVGLGHSGGMQSLTFMIRSLSIGKIRLSDARRTLSREIQVGVITGTVIGVLSGIGVWLWQEQAILGMITSVTIFVTLIVGVLGGVLFPFFLKMLRVNPARGATAFVTTITYLSGVWFFLQSCTIALQMGYL